MLDSPRPFTLKNCCMWKKCWKTICSFVQLTYVFGWIWSPSALVHRKSLIKSLFSTFPWHVITCDLPTGKRIGACGGVIRRWAFSQLTLSGNENKHKKNEYQILFELQTNWINTFMSTILAKFSKQNSIQRKLLPSLFVWLQPPKQNWEYISHKVHNVNVIESNHSEPSPHLHVYAQEFSIKTFDSTMWVVFMNFMHNEKKEKKFKIQFDCVCINRNDNG